jgi:hopanoid-associated phosphorylase
VTGIDRPAIGIVTGLAFEANSFKRHLPEPQAFAVALSGGDAARALSEARRLIGDGAGGLVSFGTAGALAPTLAPGDVIVATEVLAASGGAVAAERAWCDALAAAASAQGLPLHLGAIRAVDQPVASADAKSALYRSCGALAVDMESGAVARAARDAGLPFAVLRVVIDAAGRDLPPAAMAAMAPGGGIDAGGLARELWREPRQIGGLLNLARDAAVARRALGRAAALLGAVLLR